MINDLFITLPIGIDYIVVLHVSVFSLRDLVLADFGQVQLNVFEHKSLWKMSSSKDGLGTRIFRLLNAVMEIFTVISGTSIC